MPNKATQPNAAETERCPGGIEGKDAADQRHRNDTGCQQPVDQRAEVDEEQQADQHDGQGHDNGEAAIASLQGHRLWRRGPKRARLAA